MSAGVNIVHSMWLFKHKFHADGTSSHYKACLVANDSSQQLGVNFNETFSPVIKLATIRTVLSLAISLYGLKQAPHAWFQQFAGYATQAGFYYSRCDSLLFIYRQGSQVTYLLFYVDDIILTASCLALLQQIIDPLNNSFDISADRTDLGGLNYFLGISTDCTPTCLFLSQKKYALQLLQYAHMGTLDLGLHLYASSIISLVGYTDVDWAGCPSTCRSTS
ncbi:ribonuclease H-like domain-containing protein, partial [Tanacetum coccineum]